MLSPGGFVRQGSKKGACTASVNVNVAVRCRPLNDTELSSSEESIVRCDSNRSEIYLNSCSGRKAGSAGLSSRKTFTYDRVFGPTSSQHDVYEGVVRPIVTEVLEGYNCTVFAYGQTGTGKTFTMEGEVDTPVLPGQEREMSCNAGMIPRAVKQVFEHLRNITDDHTVRVSHLELYNEQLADLLGRLEDSADLRLYEDQSSGIFVRGLDELVVRSEEEIFDILSRSASKRKTAETLMNKFSSRSHSIFSISIHIKESSPDGTDLLKVGKLNLVDLAGSENVGRSGAIRYRAREAGNINQSLLTLGRVISALVEHHPHIPYRDSKLTRLLQESLGGRNKTCVIATVTAGSSSFEETASTLDYAYRAKSIKNRPTVNQMVSKKAVMQEYANEITKLKRQLDVNRSRNGVYLPLEEFTGLESSHRELEAERDELKIKIEDLQKQLGLAHCMSEKRNEELVAAQSRLDDESNAKAAAVEELEKERCASTRYAKNEEVLLSQLDSYTRIMKEKDRREEINVAAINNLRDSVVQATSIIHQRIRSFQLNHELQLQALRNNMMESISNVEDRVLAVSEHISSLNSSMVSCVRSEEASSYDNFVHESCTWVENHAAEHIRGEKATMTTSLTAVSSFSDSIECMLTKLVLDLQKVQCNFQNFGATQSALIRELVLAAREGLTSVGSEVAICLASQEGRLSSLHSSIQQSFRHQTTLNHEMKNELMEKIGCIIESAIRQKESSSEREYRTILESISALKEDSLHGMKQVESRCCSLIDEIDNVDSKCGNEIEKMSRIVIASSAASLTSVDATRNLVSSYVARTAERIDSATREKLEFETTIISRLCNLREASNRLAEQRVVAEAKNAQDLEESRNYALGCLSDTASQATLLSESLSSCCEHQIRLVSDICEGTSHSLNASISDSVQSWPGSAPVSKAFQALDYSPTRRVRTAGVLQGSSSKASTSLSCIESSDRVVSDRSSEVLWDGTNRPTLSYGCDSTTAPARARKGTVLRRPQVLSTRRPEI